MQLGDAVKIVDQKINELEAQLYEYDAIIAPRAEKDKEILRKLRDDRLKMTAIRDKLVARDVMLAEGKSVPPEKEVSQEELRAAIPASFR